MPEDRGVDFDQKDDAVRTEGINHLLVIAIDEYAHTRPLRNCVRDQGQFVFRLRGQDTFVDPRDEKVYRTVKINGKVWMAQNLDYDAGEGSSYYADDPRIGKVFGRLYSWEAAKKACLPGWHLPSIEEWGELHTYFGHPRAALIEGGESGFNALLAAGVMKTVFLLY